MPRKRRSRKGRVSRSIKGNRGPTKRADELSFGSGLDEVGYRPLGRRILVSKRRAEGERAKTAFRAEAESPVANDSAVSPADDPLGYDTRDPSWVQKAAEHALAGVNKEAIEKEIDAALRRWGLRD